MKFRVVIQPDDDGGFSASCPRLPGCWSQGETIQEAKTNIEDAVKGYLESLKKHGDPMPPPTLNDNRNITLENGYGRKWISTSRTDKNGW